MLKRFHICDEALEKGGGLRACVLTDKELDDLPGNPIRCRTHNQLIGMTRPIRALSREEVLRLLSER